MTKIILTLDSLSIAFDPKKPLVSDLNLTLKQGECLTLVGESGSGKTLTALSIPQLLPHGAMISEKSKIIFDGCDLLKQSNRAMDKLRGSKIGVLTSG